MRDTSKLSCRVLSVEEMIQRSAAITAATNDLYAKVREEAMTRMSAHIEWVAQCAVTFGYNRDDLQIIARNADVSYSYILLIDKRTTNLLGEAHLNWVHDELQITLKSVYGTEPEDPA
jgi:hypothetical protein